MSFEEWEALIECNVEIERLQDERSKYKLALQAVKCCDQIDRAHAVAKAALGEEEA